MKQSRYNQFKQQFISNLDEDIKQMQAKLAELQQTKLDAQNAAADDKKYLDYSNNLVLGEVYNDIVRAKPSLKKYTCWCVPSEKQILFTIPGWHDRTFQTIQDAIDITGYPNSVVGLCGGSSVTSNWGSYRL